MHYTLIEKLKNQTKREINVWGWAARDQCMILRWEDLYQSFCCLFFHFKENGWILRKDIYICI